MIFEARNIDVGYKGKSVLHCDAIKVKSGQAYFLVGKNGSGKTTLLKSMCSLLPLIKGNLCINENPLNGISIKERSKLFTYVQSSSERVDHLRVRDFVSFGRMPYTDLFGRLKKEDHEIVNHAMGLLKIQKLANRYVTSLSDGEFRKAQMAKAFCQQTELLFVDEPAAHLDIAAKAELFHLFQKMAKEMGKALVISTHEVHAAIELSDEMWIIQNGQLYSGLAKQFLSSGKIDEVFGNEFVSFKEEHVYKQLKIV